MASFFISYRHGAFLMALLTLFIFWIGIFLDNLWWLYLLLTIASLYFARINPAILRFCLTLCSSMMLSLILLLSYDQQQRRHQAVFGQTFPIHTIEGIVLDDVTQQEQFQIIKVQLLRAFSDTTESSAHGQIRIKIPLQHPSFFKGNLITIQFKAFDPQEFYAPLNARKLEIGGYENQLWQVRADLIENLRRFFSTQYPQQTGLFSALLWGDRSGLTPFQSHYIRAAGLSHLLALSGMHLGLIIAILLPLMTYFLGKRASLWVMIVLLLPYLFLTGFPSSLVRAYLAFLLGALIWIYGRTARPLDLLGLGVLIILLINPSYLFSLGWQLSFAAVFGIITLQKLYASALRYFPKILRHAMSVGLSAMTTTTPILAMYFPLIYAQGLLATIIVTPLLLIWIFIGFLGLMLPITKGIFSIFDEFLWSIIRAFSWIQSLSSLVGVIIFSLILPLFAYFLTRRMNERTAIKRTINV